ncbi:MAG: PfkB family carbohydrate kinase, partial [Actinomycetes bacterium]|nr:PfkB family carbohydrate kinase [Actinomycetes bacterium]MDX5400736.1 PfkB family carbohydrate kinase [Actinomycetes bacterium]
MMRVIHTGQALVDVVVQIEALPERGGNAMARSRRHYAAGAVTILLAAARAGATAVHAGAVGTGQNGDLIRATLAAEGVTVSSPPVEGMDTGICVVAVEATGERTFITTMEAERHITVESLATSRPGPGDLVCVTGYSLFEPTREPLLAFLESLDDGVHVVLDPGDAFATMPEDVRRRALAVTDVWTSNSTEAWDVTGEG